LENLTEKKEVHIPIIDTGKQSGSTVLLCNSLLYTIHPYHTSEAAVHLSSVIASD